MHFRGFLDMAADGFIRKLGEEKQMKKKTETC